ncbi:hypothetical protein [Agromyces ramosus]|nr:hypothetical protein [Agromyces ramosus]
MSDINTPAPDDPGEEPDTKRPPEEMSSYNIDVPPTEDGEIPGVPDESDALGEATDEPGANATGVGA